jgi:hypothetical protein
MKEIQALAKDLSLMVLFDPESLSCMEAANTGLKRFQNGILKQEPAPKLRRAGGLNSGLRR